MRKIALILSGVLVLAGAGCSSGSSATGGSSGASAKPATPTHSVNVTEGDMFLRSSATSVASGKVTFDVTNNGNIDHEFVIVTGDPTGTTGEEDGQVSEDNHIGGDEGPEIGNIAPGQTKQLTVSLTPGTYTAMCNLPGHFAAGMHFIFTVA